MLGKLLSVQSICSLLIVVRIYYTFTIDNIDEIHLQNRSCDIAKSYILNDTSHIIPYSTNTSIIYPLLSCGIPYKMISIFNDISPIPISDSYNLIDFLPKIYSFEVSLFIQACFVRICHLLTIFDVDSCKLLYCSSMITLAFATHNISSYTLQLNILIVFIWFILESRRYCTSTKMLIARNMICGIFMTLGVWVNIIFLLYSYPYIVFVFIDNAILWKMRSKENAQKNVVRTTLNLSIWSTFFALSIVIVGVTATLTDIRYFGKPRLIPLDQYDAFWDKNTNHYSLYTHLLFNMPYLYSFLFFYLVYFIYRYNVRGLEIALFYSNEMALLINSAAFKKKQCDNDLNKKLRSPVYILVFYYALLLNLFSSICILSLFHYQSYELLIPLLFPLIILSSGVFKPWHKSNDIDKDTKGKKSKDDKTKLMEFIAAVRGKDKKGKQLKAEQKIHILLVIFWFTSNIVNANSVSY